MKQISDSFHISVFAVFLSIPVDFIGGAIGGILFGYLADKYGRKPLLLASVLIFGIASLLAAFTSSVFEIYILWFFVGLGVNSQNGILYPLIVETLKKSSGTIGGIMQSFYFLGFLLDSVAYMIFNQWRIYFIAVGLISIIISFLSTILIKETLKKRNIIRKGISQLKGKLALYTIAFSSVVVGAFVFSVPLMGVVSTALVEMKLNTIYITIFSFIGFVAFILAGYLSVKIGRALTTVIFTSMGVIFSFFLLFANSNELIIIAFILVYISSGYFSFTRVWSSENYPPDIRATATNIVFFTGRLLAGFSPIFVSIIYPESLKNGIALIGIIASIIAIFGAILFLITNKFFKYK